MNDKGLKMNYESFKEAAVEKFMEYMPAEMQSMKVKVLTTPKVNMTLDGLNLVDPLTPNRVSPTIYLNVMYEEYQKTGDFDSVLHRAAQMMVKAMRNTTHLSLDFSYEAIKDQIVFQLINTEQNAELLAGVPHREYLDLSIVYRYSVDLGEEGSGSVLITNALAEKVGMSEAQLFKAAAENTRQINPPVVLSLMDEVEVRRMLLDEGFPEGCIDSFLSEGPSNLMWEITNQKYFYGAASILYEDILHDLAAQLDDELYIIPASIHSVIAVPASAGDPIELAKMVYDVNQNQVPLDERLSNQVYHYDKDLRKVSLATDTPHKRLDDAGTEPDDLLSAASRV